MTFKIPDDLASWSDQRLARAVTVRAEARYGANQLRNPKLSEAERTEKFVQIYDKAARDYGFASHADLPIGVRLKIGVPGGGARALMCREIDTTGPAVYEEQKGEELELFPADPPPGKKVLTLQEEEELARELIALVGDYHSSGKAFLRVFGPAAKSKGYRSYNALPKGTKRFISSAGGLASREKRWKKEQSALQIQLFEMGTAR